MFARLQTHASKIEGEIHKLEKMLENKTKAMYSISSEDCASEATATYMAALLKEMEKCEQDTRTMAADLSNSNRECRILEKNYKDDIANMSEQIEKIESHLEEFGYVRWEKFNISSGENTIDNEISMSQDREPCDSFVSENDY